MRRPGTIAKRDFTGFLTKKMDKRSLYNMLLSDDLAAPIIYTVMELGMFLVIIFCIVIFSILVQGLSISKLLRKYN